MRQFDANSAVRNETAGGETLRLQKEISEDGQELRLYCHSAGREASAPAMLNRFTQCFEAELKKIADALSKPRGEKCHESQKGHILVAACLTSCFGATWQINRV